MSEIHQTEEEIRQHEEELDHFKMTQFNLNGKVAIITGGNTGLGQGYAVAMAEAGADISFQLLAEQNGITHGG